MRGHGGLIIGRGGENVKRMERESGGARMKMDRDKQVVVVTGFADQVARAVRLVEACVDRAVAGAKQKELSAMHAAGAAHTPPAAWTAPPESGEILDAPRDDPARDDPSDHSAPGLGETEETFRARANPPAAPRTKPPRELFATNDERCERSSVTRLPHANARRTYTCVFFVFIRVSRSHTITRASEGQKVR